MSAWDALIASRPWTGQEGEPEVALPWECRDCGAQIPRRPGRVPARCDKCVEAIERAGEAPAVEPEIFTKIRDSLRDE